MKELRELEEIIRLVGNSVSIIRNRRKKGEDIGSMLFTLVYDLIRFNIICRKLVNENVCDTLTEIMLKYALGGEEK